MCSTTVPRIMWHFIYNILLTRAWNWPPNIQLPTLTDLLQGQTQYISDGERHPQPKRVQEEEAVRSKGQWRGNGPHPTLQYLIIRCSFQQFQHFQHFCLFGNSGRGLGKTPYKPARRSDTRPNCPRYHARASRRTTKRYFHRLQANAQRAPTKARRPRQTLFRLEAGHK
jgi:hypothetical protein